MNREDKEKSAIPFASGMGFERQFWVFVFGCVLGVAVEVLWCWLKTGTIESRSGLIYGPFNPVYGGGALLMTVLMLLWNYIITPLYMHTARADVAAMLVPVFVPFNLLKGVLVSILTFFLYKRVERLFFRRSKKD